MPHQTDRLSCKSRLSGSNTLILHHAVAFLLLTHSHGGQSLPIKAVVGDSITLPCHAESAMDVVSELVEWTRPDLDPRFVHVRRSGEDHLVDQNPSYNGRTSVSIDGLKQGNMSLKLSEVKLSDKGTYRCFVPELQIDASVQLVVDDLLPEPSRSSASIIIGLVVGFMFVLAVAFFVWKWRQNKTENQTYRVDEEAQRGGGKRSSSSSNESEQESLIDKAEKDTMKNQDEAEEENNIGSKETELLCQTEEEIQSDKLRTEGKTNEILTQREEDTEKQSADAGTGSQHVMENGGHHEVQTITDSDNREEQTEPASEGTPTPDRAEREIPKGKNVPPAIGGTKTDTKTESTTEEKEGEGQEKNGDSRDGGENTTAKEDTRPQCQESGVQTDLDKKNEADGHSPTEGETQQNDFPATGGTKTEIKDHLTIEGKEEEGQQDKNRDKGDGGENTTPKEDTKPQSPESEVVTGDNKTKSAESEHEGHSPTEGETQQNDPSGEGKIENKTDTEMTTEGKTEERQEKNGDSRDGGENTTAKKDTRPQSLESGVQPDLDKKNEADGHSPTEGETQQNDPLGEGTTENKTDTEMTTEGKTEERQEKNGDSRDGGENPTA